MSNRVLYVDLSKGIGIMMIMLLHLCPANSLKNVLLSTSVPLFFSLTGTVTKKNNTLQRTSIEFTKSKVHGLLIPYYLFGLVYLIVFSAMNRMFSEKIFVKIVSTSGISVLWFLGTLFWGCIAFYYIKKNFPKYRGSCCLILLSCSSVYLYNYLYLDQLSVLSQIFVLSIIRIVAILPFIDFGYNFSRIDNFIRKGSFHYKILILLMFSAICLLASHYNKLVDINRGIFGNHVLLFYISGFSGIIAINMFSILLEDIRIKSLNTFIVFIGTNSLLIMCTHEYLGPRYLASVIGNEFIRWNLAISFFIVLMFELVIIKLFGKIYSIICEKVWRQVNRYFIIN